MKGPPLRQRRATVAELAPAVHAALADCTCNPVIHAYDAGDGVTGVSILHDHLCARLAELKASQS
jgi:hypothetical protein